MQEKKEYEFCLRCGRKLKTPIAREKGYGAVCEQKLRVEQSVRLFETMPHLQSSQKEKDLH